jgi:hypothetical protein
MIKIIIVSMPMVAIMQQSLVSARKCGIVVFPCLVFNFGNGK